MTGEQRRDEEGRDEARDLELTEEQSEDVKGGIKIPTKRVLEAESAESMLDAPQP